MNGSAAAPVVDYKTSLATDNDLYAQFVSAMADNGRSHHTARQLVSFGRAHTLADVEQTLAAVEESLAQGGGTVLRGGGKRAAMISVRALRFLLCPRCWFLLLGRAGWPLDTQERFRERDAPRLGDLSSCRGCRLRSHSRSRERIRAGGRLSVIRRQTAMGNCCSALCAKPECSPGRVLI